MPALLLLLLLPLLALAQPDTTWSRGLKLGDRAFLYDAVLVDDTVIVACGYSQYGTGQAANFDYLLTAYTTSGDSLYARPYLATENDEALEGIVHLGGDTVVACGWSGNGHSIDLMAFSVESGDLFWQRSYAPSSGLCKGRDLIILADGRLAAVGYGLPNGEQRSDAWLVVCDRNGDSLWSQFYGDGGTDIGNSLIQLPSDQLRLVGITRESQFTDYDQWTQLINLDGTPVGSPVQFGTAENDYCYNVNRAPDGATWLIGRGGPNSGGYGYVTILPVSGTPVNRTYSSTGFTDQFRAALPWFGGMLFVGRSGDDPTVTTFLMRAVNDNNQTIWVWRYGAESSEAGFYNVIPLPDGAAIAVGAMAMEGDTADVRGYLLRIAPPAGIRGTVVGQSTGDPVSGAQVRVVGEQRFAWTDEQGEFRLDLAAGMHDVMVTGYCTEADTAFGILVQDNDLTEVNFSVGEPVYGMRPSSVNIIAQNRITGGGEIFFENAGTGTMSYTVEADAVAPEGSWIAVNPTAGTLLPGETAFIEIVVNADTTDNGVFEFIGELTLRSNACPDTLLELPILVTVLDAPETAGLPTAFRLSPAFPNPFNGSTRVTLELPQETPVSLEVFNLNGQQVLSLLNDRLPAGNHNISINLADFGAGLYFLRARVLEDVAVQKLLFVK
ncbi:MAG: carboxypeptidase regulatory-like domain-containing protein [bacterium]|nr:carboxypeptidase regulatory-like domain-containing protein [bacterium]